MTTGTHRLVELSAPALADTLTRDSVVVLPTGSIEQHGPHLPLVTDHLLADSVATAAVQEAARQGLDAWLLPALAYTKSDEHANFPGTVWLSWDTLMRTLVDIGRSVAATPATRLVFCNGHGGNTALLQVANRELRRQFGLRTFAMPALSFGAEPPDGEGLDERGLSIHGGTIETSAVLHLRPDLVDLGRARREVPEHVADFDHIGFNAKPVSFGWLADDFGPSGVIGDPTQATAAYGKAVFEYSVTQAVAALHEIARFDPAGP